jgi:hypothetical protein
VREAKPPLAPPVKPEAKQGANAQAAPAT